MSLQQLINEKLRKEQEERKEGSGKFAPYLLGRCFRCQILTRAKVTPSNPPDDRALRIFKCGKLFHDFVQNFLPDNQTEIRCETEDFKGRADIVTEDSVYDIKSVHSASFFYANKPGYDVKKEKYHNWLQLAFYASVLKKEKIILVQISKDDMCINEYVDYTNKWEEELNAEKITLLSFWNSYQRATIDPLPEAMTRFNKECKYCNYIDYCKGIEKDGNREHPLDKSKPNIKKSRRS